MDNWRHLPSELLRSIAKNLSDLRDYIRFRGVCPSWRHATGATDLGPWLVAPTLREGCKRSEDGTTIISFFNLHLTSSYHRLQVPESQGMWVFGSAHGWLLMIGSPQSDKSSVCLLNPITKAEVPLPQLSTTPEIGLRIRKAILCSHPASSKPGQLLASILISKNNLAFYRQGDDEWTIVQCPPTIDIVFYEDHIYSINHRGELSVLQIESSKVTPLIHPSQLQEKPFRSLQLVDACGDLLLVARCYLQHKLAVFKLDRNGNSELSWVSMASMTLGMVNGYTDLDKLTGCNYAFFTRLSEALCAQALPNSRGYRIFFADAKERDSLMNAAIREFHAVPGVGIKMVKQPNWEANVRVGRQRQPLAIGVSWMMPNLY